MADRRQAKSERRQKIVDAAAALFIEQGIHQTGIRDIATRAGISLGNMYNYFASKDELIEEIADLESAGLAQFTEALEGAADVRAGIDSFVMAYLDYVSDPVNAVLTIEITSEAVRNPSIAESFDNNREFLRAALSRTLARGVAQGTLDASLDREETAGLILEVIEGLGLRAGLSDRKPSKAARLALLMMVRRGLAVSGD